jgi:hypothetical protein
MRKVCKQKTERGDSGMGQHGQRLNTGTCFYIVLIKGGASERCDFSQFGKRHHGTVVYFVTFLSVI